MSKAPRRVVEHGKIRYTFKHLHQTDYGLVLVMSGYFKGKIGFYDDEEPGANGLRAVVYFDTDDYRTLKFENLLKLDDSLIQRTDGPPMLNSSTVPRELPEDT